MEDLVNYYQFKKEDAYSFTRAIGVKAKERGNELVFASCPYCRSMKDKETFSINLTDGRFQCKRASCGAKGNMITLSRDFDFSLGSDVDVYYRRSDKTYRPARTLPAYVPKNPVVQYMKKRGISAEIVEKYRLSLKDGTENIMAIPFVNAEGLLECVKYRKMDFDKSMDKNKEWFEVDCKPILFGMGQCEDRTRLVITEGQMDALALAEAGIKNPVSVPNGANGFTWIPHCWDFVIEFDEIVVFGDCEKGKITLIDTIFSRFGRKKVFQVQEEDYKGCKDANDILKQFGAEQLIKAVENAKIISSGAIIEMADVEDVDVESIESITTGFPTLDDKLSGGIHAGTLTIVTGKRGDGKSTFVSQIVANALSEFDRTTEDRYKAFIYSGELTNENVKNWMMQQLSGQKKPDKSLSQRVNGFLRGHAYMYDCNKVDDELTEVPVLVEDSICKFGCRVIVIDNLMTAISAETNDVYKEQALFTSKIAKLAKKYNVFIFLIAHPRKGDSEDKNDLISGSSQITDRADIVLHYDRDNEILDHQRAISITKNRLTGILATKKKRIIADYDETNKRITEEHHAPRSYPWDEGVDGLHPAGEQEEIPFE